ncbi:UvrABC system protein C [uncultured archaeon]|nr:UvrABC system protein C [uncultured archaeon]
MGFFEAAERVLNKTKRPMRPNEITDIALKNGFLETSGKTPRQTMASRLYTDVLRKGRMSRFVQLDKGLFGLRRINYTSGRSIAPTVMERRPVGIVTEYSDLMSAAYLDDVIEYLADKPGIYALYGENEELWYVGLATNLKTRLRQHQSDRHRGRWTKFRIFVVPNNRLDAVETILIQIACPKGNRTKGNIRGAKNITDEIRRDFIARIRKYERF